MQKRWLMAGAALLLAGTVDAQSEHGRVIESRSGRWLALATVTAMDENGDPVAQTRTDGLGRYALRLPRAGRYALRAERMGYRAAILPPWQWGESSDLYRLLLMRQDAPLGSVGEEGRGRGFWPNPGFIPRSRGATDTRPKEPSTTRAPHPQPTTRPVPVGTGGRAASPERTGTRSRPQPPTVRPGDAGGARRPTHP